MLFILGQKKKKKKKKFLRNFLVFAVLYITFFQTLLDLFFQFFNFGKWSCTKMQRLRSFQETSTLVFFWDSRGRYL